MQQKINLPNQWQYSRKDLLGKLKRKLDKINRKDIENLVQIPDGECDFFEEEDDDISEEDEYEEEDPRDKQSLLSPVIEVRDDAETTLPSYASEPNSPKEHSVITPVLSAVVSSSTSKQTNIEQLQHRIAALESYVKM